MGSTRLALRQLLGEGLPRRYYVKSTTTGTSTASEIVDSKRVEDRDFWNGASLRVGGEDALVRGGSGLGRLYLDTPLAAIPSSGASYELCKGVTVKDLDRSLDDALAFAYPWLYLPVNDDTTFTETTGTQTINLTATWREIKRVRREIVGTSPRQWEQLQRGYHYEIRQGTAGLVFEMFYTALSSTKLHFVGDGVMTLAAADASTCLAPDQVLVEGALWRLYLKGVAPDDTALNSKFEQMAPAKKALFVEARQLLAMPRENRTMDSPQVAVTNDGTSERG